MIYIKENKKEMNANFIFHSQTLEKIFHLFVRYLQVCRSKCKAYAISPQISLNFIFTLGRSVVSKIKYSPFPHEENK